MADEMRRAVEAVAEVFGGRRGAGLNPIALEGARAAIESLGLTPVGWYCYEAGFVECAHDDGRCGPVYRLLFRTAIPTPPPGEPPPGEPPPGEPPPGEPPPGESAPDSA